MRKNSNGMTLAELLVTVACALIILTSVTLRSYAILQRVKVSSAQAAVNTIAMALGQMKDDTGLYPQQLAELRGLSAPSGANVPARLWGGPYLNHRISLVDPWGSPYFYELVYEEFEAEPESCFGPFEFERIAGSPYDETFVFDAWEGEGGIVIINEEEAITAGWIWINGELVVSPNEFKKHSPLIENHINLLAENNTIRIRLASGPAWTINLGIYSLAGGVYYCLHSATFNLGSYGADGQSGGEGYNSEIIYGRIR